MLEIRAVFYDDNVNASSFNDKELESARQLYKREPDAYGIYFRNKDYTLTHMDDFKTKEEAELEIKKAKGG